MKPTENPTLSRVISKDSTEIGYFTTGDGPPLLLVHGGLGDHMRWGAPLPYLEPHFKVHVLDRLADMVTGGLLVLWVAALSQQIPDDGVDLNSRNAWCNC
jgi:pimeloyl-ACP methyl ester carboxylesterase